MNSERQGNSGKKQDQPQQEQEQQQQQQQQQKAYSSGEKTSSNYNEKTTELTAEWSVHAQLTISRPNVDNSGSSRPDGDGARKPVKFVYRWSSDDTPGTTTTTTTTETPTTPSGGAGSGGGGGGEGTGERQSTPIRGTFRSDDGKSDLSGGKYVKNDSFHSYLGSGKPASDSGFSSSYYNTRGGVGNKGGNIAGGTRCRSTCSIVLSAVADFLPVCSGDIPEETDPFTYNTRTSYTVSPDKAGDDLNASQNFGGMKILALRDAFSQTSDNEARKVTEYYPQQSSQQHQTGSSIVGGGVGRTSEEKDGKKRKLYDYRRNIAPESSPADQTEEGISKSPFYSTCPPGQQAQQRPFKSPSHSSIVQEHMSSGHSTTAQRSSDPSSKKPPRTVHIDVYCTGSDAEDDDDDDRDGDESSSPSSENPNELESNSTPQTVLDIEQMLLRHHRAGKHEMPRRFKIQQQQQPQQEQLFEHQQHQQYQQQQPLQHVSSSKMIPEFGRPITKSSTAEEISESKQILFKKHIGDQKTNKYNLRSRGNFRKDPSDDCISSNYPNSSRSTMRDLTCSSISSVVASNICEDVESSWKETDVADGTITSLGKSDSFEYDNSIDRLRIKRMERLWSRPEKEHHSEQEEYKSNTSTSGSPTKQLSSQQRHHIQDFLQNIQHLPHIHVGQQYEQLTPPDYNIYYTAESQCIEYPSIIPEKDEPSPSPSPSPESNIMIVSKTIPTQRLILPSIQSSIPVIKTERILKQPSGISSDQDGGAVRSYFRHSSSEPRSPERLPSKTLFYAEYNKSGSEASTLQSNLSGYTSEYLAKARKFGTVVTALKKPGHHIGPAKNPECQCEHCRRWMAERSIAGGMGGGRGRAFSMSDAFNIKQGFWLRKGEKS